MYLDKSKMIDIVKTQLAIDMNCSKDELSKEGIIFCEAGVNKGRRKFDRQSPFLEIVTMGKSTIVSGDREILDRVKPIFDNKSKEDVFAAPFFYGHSLYYIPDYERIKSLELPKGYTLHIREGKDIHELYKYPGFENAIMYDINHPRPDVLAIYATFEEKIVAMAGASEDSPLMWQIGIDVLPEYRNKGLATTLVSNLAIMIMDKGVVPYYGTGSYNIPSQAVAYKSGFIPTWMCSYRNIFDGNSPFGDYIKINF